MFGLAFEDQGYTVFNKASHGKLVQLNNFYNWSVVKLSKLALLQTIFYCEIRGKYKILES
ncbi:hypothetical protein psyc5s11_16120 [Clostridium gelidum]|uniref:Uncharacterized protein n=1 Tax=Clostridium gelidum TaxID=704125 RepID=A0ABM7T9D7_9CLOT|nr:hypothetical protein [Clostridium gelidum]BCZ45545.1 hypothetical protein psyc5s11_16120 [Clostridium gelidum]